MNDRKESGHVSGVGVFFIKTSHYLVSKHIIMIVLTTQKVK